MPEEPIGKIFNSHLQENFNHIPAEARDIVSELL